MTDFDYDVMQRKRTARGARHKINGSKSRKCSLPSDNMTKKQWKERNGSVMTYRLNSPMSWSMFKSMPESLQEEYIRSIISRYQVTATALSKMFGCARGTTTRYLRDKFGIEFHVGATMPKGCVAAFERFCDEDFESEDIRIEPAPTLDTGKQNDDNINKCADENIVAAEPVSECGAMSMTHFSVKFSGNFSRTMLFNSLVSILPEGQEVELEVNCIMKPANDKV